MDSNDPDLDTILARAAARGDAAAAAALFRRHAGAVRACCARLTGDAEAAQDLTQDVFLRMLREVGRFRGEARFRTWLLRVAHNVAIDWRRAAESRRKGEARMANEPVVGTPDQGSALARRDLIERALEQLRPESRAALILARFHDLPHAELAIVLDCSVAAARVRVHRAMQELRAAVLALEGGAS